MSETGRRPFTNEMRVEKFWRRIKKTARLVGIGTAILRPMATGEFLGKAERVSGPIGFLTN